jgi:hypothetical protein
MDNFLKTITYSNIDMIIIDWKRKGKKTMCWNDEHWDMLINLALSNGHGILKNGGTFMGLRHFNRV